MKIKTLTGPELKEHILLDLHYKIELIDRLRPQTRDAEQRIRAAKDNIQGAIRLLGLAPVRVPQNTRKQS